MVLIRRVFGESMQPVLRPGRIVVAAKLGQAYQPGDVVIVAHDGLEIIKRIMSIRIVGRRTEIFVRGDNSAASTDSRHYGWLTADNLKGKVIWPTRLHKNLTH